MKIKALRIKAFGKFKDKIVTLKPGLNIIYGDNESGKTTMQAFIQGMFFGFYKPYRKKKTYSDDYEKYMPWAQFDYSGLLVYEMDGEELRLERNFLRGKDNLAIFNNASGADVTDHYKYDPVIRQHLPLGHLGITPGIYNSVVNLKQVGHDFDPRFKEEVRASYFEMQNSGAMDINLSKVEENLENRKKKIGRAKLSKSKLGLLIRKKEELTEALREAEKVYDKVNANQKTITAYQKRLKKAEIENDYLIQETVVKHKRDLLKSYEKIGELEKENIILQDRIEALGDKEDYNQETLENLRTTKGQINRLTDQMDYIEKEINDLVGQQKNIRQKEDQKRQLLDGNSLEQIVADYETFNQERLEKEERLQKKKVAISSVSIALAVVGLFLIGADLMKVFPLDSLFERIAFFMGAFLVVFGVVGSSYGIITSIKLRRNRYYLQMSPDQEEILDKYQIEDPIEFDEVYKNANRIKRDLEQYSNENKLLSVQLSRHQAGFDVLFEQKRGINRELETKFANFKVNSVEEYAKNCEIAREIKELKEELKSNQTLIDHFLEAVESGEEKRVSDTWKQSNPMADELLAIGKKIAALEGENAALTEGVDLPVELRETIESLDKQIRAYNLEIDACDAALAALRLLNVNNHKDAVPTLNDQIGTVLKEVTQRYKGVKIDDAMKVKVEDPYGGDLRESDQLSAGTKDQVHFAFRYGMGNLITHDMPFILDEPFARYDEKRKIKALSLLVDLSQHRQVILFTCSRDEEKILERLKKTYHRIDL